MTIKSDGTDYFVAFDPALENLQGLRERVTQMAMLCKSS